MKPSNRSLILFVILAYVLSWLIWSIGIFRMDGDYQLDNLGVLFYLGTFGPSLAALIVTGWSEGWGGVRTLLSKLIRWQVGWKPYTILFFVTPLVFMIGLLVLGLRPAEGELPFLFIQVVLTMPLNALLTGLLEPGPLGEELGWRGFMLPRLLERFGDWGSSIILGLVWSFWHLPIFLFVDWRQGLPLLTFTLLYPVTLIAWSFAMTKLYHWSQGSVLTAVLMHGAVNFATAQLIDPEAFNLSARSSVGVYLSVVGVFLLLALSFWALDTWVFKGRTWSQETAKG